jgi:hypothetical protein
MSEQQQLWERVRARLKGELLGSMAAPGSPPGALAPVQPRPHQVDRGRGGKGEGEGEG